MRPRHFVRSQVGGFIVALLAVCGVFGVIAHAGRASPGSAQSWAKRHPAKSPAARYGAAMAYDAATRHVVLFGGVPPNSVLALGDTWTWNGSTWTRRHPAKSPLGRSGAAMTYDAATRQVVLFGGVHAVGGYPRLLDGTWTWNGSAWTKRHPAKSPPAETGAAMTYDPATRQVVLFGGINQTRYLGGTWTWNGSNWTRRHPAKSPPAESGAAMAYDAATRQVVQFGGFSVSGTLDGTWTWNGSTWTRQHPASSPPAASEEPMAYDAATRQVVLFGGINQTRYLGGTWTWNGSNWTRRHPAKSPPAEFAASMAYDAAAGNVVLFGGVGPRRNLNDTWIWR